MGFLDWRAPVKNQHPSLQGTVKRDGACHTSGPHTHTHMKLFVTPSTIHWQVVRSKIVPETSRVSSIRPCTTPTLDQWQRHVVGRLLPFSFAFTFSLAQILRVGRRSFSSHLKTCLPHSNPQTSQEVVAKDVPPLTCSYMARNTCQEACHPPPSAHLPWSHHTALQIVSCQLQCQEFVEKKSFDNHGGGGVSRILIIRSTRF